MMVVQDQALLLGKTVLNRKTGLIVYAGQSRFFDECIELHSRATENFKRYCGLIDKDFKLDVMLSTWKEDTPEDHMDSLNKWTHGEVFSRLIENAVFDELLKYNPNIDIANYNGFKTMLGKIHALCHIYDLPNRYDFFILTRTDYHVPCFDLEDAKFHYEILNNAYHNTSTVFDGTYCYKGNWNNTIDDNYVVIASNLFYLLDKGRIKDTGLSVINYAYEKNIYSAHVVLLQFLCKLHTECDRYYDETNTVMRNSFRDENRITFFRYTKQTKIMRTLALIEALLSDYSIKEWNTPRQDPAQRY